MEYFEKYRSNTLGGSGNQTFFLSDGQSVMRGRVYYKIFAGGEYNYSLLFSNIIDSTFADGSHSHCNLVLGSWKISRASVGIVAECSGEYAAEPDKMYTLTFDGKAEKTVAPGEFFASDPVKLAPKKCEYLCLDISFCGKQIPYHEESILPTFVWERGEWKPSKLHPFASMVGCDRPVLNRVGYLGDSITQGIGTEVNSYRHWNAVLSETLGENMAFWNLGLGYGRAADAASDGAWLYRAKQNDTVFLCYGVNDIFRGYTADEIKENLNKTVDILKSNGIRVVLQTVPPFDYSGENIAKWNEVNEYIRLTLGQKADIVFDCVPLLGKSEKEAHIALYGGHPNSEGCRVWGEALYTAVKSMF